MGKQTPLHEQHIAAGAKMVDFAGWDMPINYGSQLEEHHAVRRDSGVFDVSHMTIVDVIGPGAKDYLRYLLANDVARLMRKGKALYSCMLNEQGGVVDDLIVYYLADDQYRIVVNSGTRDKDMAWLEKHVEGFDATLNERDDLAMVAVQGPQARQQFARVLSPDHAASVAELKVFAAVTCDDLFIARTGYTGEDGVEVIVAADKIAALWDQLIAVGIKPCGLGARDTLRLEAGLNLYGADMTEETTPLESNLAWTVVMDGEDRQFVGKEALRAQKEAGVKRRLVGLILEDKGVLRNHQKVFCNNSETGEITSGSFSPSTGRSIALARIATHTEGAYCVDIRGKRLAARVVKPPFVRHGKVMFE